MKIRKEVKELLRTKGSPFKFLCFFLINQPNTIMEELNVALSKLARSSDVSAGRVSCCWRRKEGFSGCPH